MRWTFSKPSPRQREIDAEILKAAKHAEPGVASFLERLVQDSGGPRAMTAAKRVHARTVAPLIRWVQLALFPEE